MRRADPYVTQLRHFGEVVAGRAEPLVSARDAAASLARVEAAKRSAETGAEAQPAGR